MFLKTLEIVNQDISIRKIEFIKGVNIIVDETKNYDRTSSGNGVGKTTVLRLIDFCLDGSGDNIYTDPEFKTHNTKVEEFLKNDKILIRLTLVEDWGKLNSGNLIIEKNFLSRKEKIQRINGEQLNKDDFSARLKELIFKTDVDKPTFKQLKAKNIRDEKHKLLNTLRVLAPNVVTDATYEILHLFWFGIDADMPKDKLTRELHFEKKMQIRFRRSSNLSQINQALIIINRNIIELENEKTKYNINENYQNDLALLNKIKKEKSVLSTFISRIELRLELINESKNELESDLANIDISSIKNLYIVAKSLVPSVQKSFEDVINFHNTMINNKIAFIIEELPTLEQELKNKKNEMIDLLQIEKKQVEKINNSILLDDLQNIINQLNALYEQRGIQEEQKRIWEESNNRLKEITDSLNSINDELSSKDTAIQDNITKFNSFFSDISNRLDGAHSILSADNSTGLYKFEITNVENNPGTGTKKSQMASFDLAYIKYADSNKIPCLHFILQDQIENVHSNQITNLLTQIVDEINCQYILPVLRDKLPSDIDVSKYEVITLSQSNKLFKI